MHKWHVSRCALPLVESEGCARDFPVSAAMLAAVLQAMLARATIRFLLRVSSQSRPGSTSQPGCPFLSSVSKTPVPPVVGSLRLHFGQMVSSDWLPTLPKTEQLLCRTNT
ncbi:hypothetical protein T08_10320 [Trichinella sp. T8]|nr:hypothetical protein T08_10320 [Trichinella sp. T8]